MAFCLTTLRIDGARDNRPLRENASTLPRGPGENRTGLQAQMDSVQLDQTSLSPRTQQIKRQRQFQHGDVAQLQCFNPPPLLEFMEEGLELPVAAIPGDQFEHGQGFLPSGCSANAVTPV